MQVYVINRADSFLIPAIVMLVTYVTYVGTSSHLAFHKLIVHVSDGRYETAAERCVHLLQSASVTFLIVQQHPKCTPRWRVRASSYG